MTDPGFGTIQLDIGDFDSDPKPDSKRKTGDKPDRPPRGRPPGRPSKASIEKELKDQLTMFLQLGGGMIAMRDECGMVVSNQAEDISDALVDIIKDNERMMAFLMSGGDMMKYIKLAMALGPVARAVKDHHFSREESPAEFDDGIGYNGRHAANPMG